MRAAEAVEEVLHENPEVVRLVMDEHRMGYLEVLRKRALAKTEGHQAKEIVRFLHERFLAAS